MRRSIAAMHPLVGRRSYSPVMPELKPTAEQLQIVEAPAAVPTSSSRPAQERVRRAR